MGNLTFDWQISEYMVYCRSRQLREKTMNSYEQALRLFERWCSEQLAIETVDKVTEGVIRRRSPRRTLHGFRRFPAGGFAG